MESVSGVLFKVHSCERFSRLNSLARVSFGTSIFSNIVLILFFLFLKLNPCFGLKSEWNLSPLTIWNEIVMCSVYNNIITDTLSSLNNDTCLYLYAEEKFNSSLISNSVVENKTNSYQIQMLVMNHIKRRLKAMMWNSK